LMLRASKSWSASAKSDFSRYGTRAIARPRRSEMPC
jgi:hypothetical protein